MASSASASTSSFSAWLNGSKNAADDSEEPLVEGSVPKKKGSGWGSLSDNAFGLSRFQRIVGFFGCLAAGLFCFGLASMYIPVLLFKSRKFAALYTLGSSFFIFSFALLWGPQSYLRHMFTQPRLPTTIAYFTTLLATLYTSLWLSNTVLTLVCAGLQVVALLWFLVSYIPGGESGLKVMGGFCTRFVRRQTNTNSSLLPV